MTPEYRREYQRNRLSDPEKRLMHSEAVARWWKQHPEMLKAKKKRYAEKHAEELKRYKREYYQKNKERVKSAVAERHRKKLREDEEYRQSRIQQSKKWQKENPEESRCIVRRRRATIKGSNGSHTAKDIAILYETQRGLCAEPNCREAISDVACDPNKFHVDHITPLSKGGSNNADNLQLLCKSCNLKKNNSSPEEWANKNWRLF